MGEVGRKIIHIDMDCYYAAIEMRDAPELRGKPMAVGGATGHGVLTTCNYEARKFGCRSAMPTFKARELCPQLILVPPRFEIYRRESMRIRAILHEYTALVEPLSLDEAYLDVSHSDRYAWDLAKEIRQKIYQTTGLTASAGIAPNKLLAKIASDWKKPNGQFAVRPEEIDAFMLTLPVERLWGVGPKGSAKLHSRGIKTCADLQRESLADLESQFGSFGTFIYKQARGIDERPVEAGRVRKSLSNERTFSQHLRSNQECFAELPRLLRELSEDLRKKSEHPPIAKLFVRLKFNDFNRTSREMLAEKFDPELFRRLLGEALARRNERPVRLIGVGVRFRDTDAPREAEQLRLPFHGVWPENP